MAYSRLNRRQAASREFINSFQEYASSFGAYPTAKALLGLDAACGREERVQRERRLVLHLAKYQSPRRRA